MNLDEVHLKIARDRDRICFSKAGDSITKLARLYPDGIEERLRPRAVGLTQEQWNERWAGIVAFYQRELGLADLPI